MKVAGLWGAPLAWLFHLLAAYVVAEFGCLSGLHQLEPGGLSAVTWGLIGVTGLALGLASGASVAAFLTWRRATSRPEGPERFLARLALWSSALFTAVIVVQAVPIGFYHHGC